MATAAKARLGSRRQPEESRAAILKAAAKEFSREGVAGARTDAIARAAGVNKALLYYYFKDKEAIYTAVLDHVLSGLEERANQVLDRDTPPKEKILAYAGAHFDYLAEHPEFPRIMQAELMSAAGKNSRHLDRIVERYFRPRYEKLSRVLDQGVAAGVFRQVSPMFFIPAMISVLVFHFSTAKVLRMMTRQDPLAPAELQQRRTAVLDFISAALFVQKGGRQ